VLHESCTMNQANHVPYAYLIDEGTCSTINHPAHGKGLNKLCTVNVHTGAYRQHEQCAAELLHCGVAT
jgi:hypothetical protein